MDEMIFYDSAKESVMNFISREFENFPPLLMFHFLNRFNDLLNYSEEGATIRPKILFTDNIDSIVRSIPKSYAMQIFEDSEATRFNNRIKSLLAISKSTWAVYIEIKNSKINYGLLMNFNSIKDRDLTLAIESNSTIKEKSNKVRCIFARALNFYSMSLHSISGNKLIVNFSLDKTKNHYFNNEINEFVDTAFSKLRTTQLKLQDMKNMYLNIFLRVMNDVHGAICVIVDKDYVDNGLFEDGIWLKEPISFSKLFTQSKSYSESKLHAYADLFFNMLNYDGITIIDNQGRLRAYNVFVEPNSRKVEYIVGGARKRAAYYILSSKRKGIVGVYFQSHEGEVFFQKCNLKHENIRFKQKPIPQKDIKEEKQNKEDPENKSNKDTN